MSVESSPTVAPSTDAGRSTDHGLPGTVAADSKTVRAADLWSPGRRHLTGALVLTITLVAFESLAISTVMPKVKDDLGGLALYGWVFSGFFLASLLGIVVAGHVADRRGLALPYAVGLLVFAGGLAVGGAATSMPMLVAARAAQGFGAGTIPAVVYAAIGRGYPKAQRSRMFATISTAWVVPGLVGPAAAVFLEHAASWRLVFLGLLPMVAAALALGVPALRGLDASANTDGADPPNSSPMGSERVSASSPADDRRKLGSAVVLVLGLAAVFAAGNRHSTVAAAAMVVVGLPLAVWAFVGLVPKGTLRLAPGVPATVGLRGLLTGGFFAADAYVPLAVVDGRHAATWIAGAALTAGCVTWTSGSWIQARLIDAYGPRRLDRAGFSGVATGIALMIGVSQGLPVGFAVLAWSIGCFGMGTAYSPLSVTVLAAARPGEEGSASAGLQLSDALGVAVGTGIGGWIIAAADHGGHSVAASTTVVFAVALVIALGGLLACSRLPATVPTGPPAD